MLDGGHNGEIVRDCARFQEIYELVTASVVCIISAVPLGMLPWALESDGSLFPKLPVHHKVRTLYAWSNA